MKAAIPASEVAALLRRAVAGEVPVLLVGPSWDDIYAGNVHFSIDGWDIAFFNDCDELDYCDAAVAPDGRRAEFDHWYDDFDEADELHIGHEPTELLSPQECDALAELLAAATPKEQPRDH